MENDLTLALQTNGEHDEPASIVIYGCDAHLLETRRWVLERAGMKVSTTTELLELKKILVHQAIDLFILCHTLSPEDSDFCLILANALRPAMKKLVLTANTPLGSHGLREAKVSAFNGPRALLSEVEKLLGAQSIERPPSGWSSPGSQL